MTSYIRKWYSSILIISILVATPLTINAEDLFVDDFEYGQIPSGYDMYMESGTSIQISTEQKYSGQKSLKLLNTNSDGSCNIRIPLNIEYSPEVLINFFHYFEESEPFYWIGVRGLSGGVIHNIILEYGNPYSNWVEETVFLVRGFNIPLNHWSKFSLNVTLDIEQALRHQNSPLEAFRPLQITYLIIALDPANQQRIVYIDALYISEGIPFEKFGGVTTSLQNFNKTLVGSFIILTVIVSILVVIRLKYNP